MHKLTKKAIRYGRTYGRTDHNYRKASLLKMGGTISLRDFSGHVFRHSVILVDLGDLYNTINAKLKYVPFSIPS